MEAKTIRLTVNGEKREVTVDPQTPLLYVLREDLGLTGTKYGCGEGQCAACTVLVEGKPIFSCVTAIQEVANKNVLTIEGLVKAGSAAPAEPALHPVQAAFQEEGAFQCGYCTSGMIMGTVALLAENPHPTDEQIVNKLNGHLCRCCGYARIFKAVHRAAGEAAK